MAKDQLFYFFFVNVLKAEHVEQNLSYRNLAPCKQVKWQHLNGAEQSCVRSEEM